MNNDVTRWIKAEKKSLFVLVSLVLGYLVMLEVWRPGFFLVDDNAGYFMPLFVHNWRAVVENHTLPFLNYYQYLGSRFLGQGQPAVFYPLMWVGLMVSKLLTGEVVRGVSVIVVMHLVLSGGGMYVWLRWKKVEKWLAIMGSLVWISFPFIVTMARAWVFMAYLMAYLPWGMGLFEKVFLEDKKGWKWLLFVKVMLGLTGYPQWMVTVSVFEMIWLGVWSWQVKPDRTKLRVKLVKYVGLVGLSWLVTAMTWVPIGYSYLISDFRKERLEFVNFAWPYVRLDGFLGAQIGRFERGHVFLTSNFVYYVGVWMLIWWSYLIWRKRRLDRYGWMVLFGWLMSSWWHNFLFLVPVLSSFRMAVKDYVWFLVFLVMSTVVLTQDWARKQEKQFKWVYVGLMMVIGVNVGLVVGRADDEQVLASEHFGLPWDYQYQKWLVDLVGDNKRLATYGADKGEGSSEYKLVTRNYASAYGLRQLGGNGLLAPKINEDLRGGKFPTSVASYFSFPSETDRERLRGLGVGYWLMPSNHMDKSVFEKAGYVEVGARDGVLVFEDEKADDLIEMNGVGEYEWGINSIKVKVGEGLEQVKIKVAPLDWYYVWLDGKFKGRAEKMENGLMVRIPKGTKEVVVSYVDWSFWVGLGISGLGVGYYLYVARKKEEWK